MRFDDIGGLGGGARGVRGGEVACVGASGQVGDERRNVVAGDGAAILGANAGDVGAGDHPLTAIAGDVWVDAALQGA